jgi:ABC-type uncharacterized transport system auxiliary subunit
MLSPIIIILSALISACSIPETKIYNLHVNESGRSKNILYKKTGSSIAIHVEAPDYLAQPYIVTRTSPYEIKISKTAKWESPPKRFIKQALKKVFSGSGYFDHVSLSQIKREGYYWLIVDLKRFELVEEDAGFSGEVIMDVSLFDHEMNSVFMSTINRKKQIRNKDYRNLAAVLGTFIPEGLDEIKDTVIRNIQGQH